MLNKKKIVKTLGSVQRISVVFISKAFLSAKTEVITALAGCLSIGIRAKEIALTRYLKRGRPGYWPPLNNLNSHKLIEYIYYTDSQANSVFGYSPSSSNTNEIQKTSRTDLYMKWYEIFCQAVKPKTLHFCTDHNDVLQVAKTSPN